MRERHESLPRDISPESIPGGLPHFTPEPTPEPIQERVVIPFQYNGVPFMAYETRRGRMVVDLDHRAPREEVLPRAGIVVDLAEYSRRRNDPPPDAA